MPISAFLFGTARDHRAPGEISGDWERGSWRDHLPETTRRVWGRLRVRRDPFAMLPFCGYHFGDYFQHWLKVGSALKEPPRIFGVNWFRLDENGKFMWPGYGENMRVLKWVVERCNGNAGAVDTPLGHMPRYEDMEWQGLDGFSRGRFEQLVAVDRTVARRVKDHRCCYSLKARSAPSTCRAAGTWSALVACRPLFSHTSGRNSPFSRVPRVLALTALLTH